MVGQMTKAKAYQENRAEEAIFVNWRKHALRSELKCPDLDKFIYVY